MAGARTWGRSRPGFLGLRCSLDLWISPVREPHQQLAVWRQTDGFENAPVEQPANGILSRRHARVVTAGAPVIFAPIAAAVAAAKALTSKSITHGSNLICSTTRNQEESGVP
ncbi:MAG: hypothetical protein KatS3mg060_1645 [Dehalococcoidia bacterium]|nr:MAG: hypothetical protein KatS3mg060_1645 [Dehalococcoidia bacterium]